MTDTMVDDLLTYQEAADQLRVSLSTVKRLVREEHLRPIRLKGQRRPYIERRDLRAYAAHREPLRKA